jgi:WD40 repeat protein
MTWSLDDTDIAWVGGDNTVQVWQAATGRQIIVYKGHSATVVSVAWSPDGKEIASGNADNHGNNTVQVWEAP